MSHDSSDFIVKLNGIKLPKEAEAKIAAEVRATVLRHLAGLDMKVQGISTRIPDKEWQGIWIETYKGPGPVPNLAVNEVR